MSTLAYSSDRHHDAPRFVWPVYFCSIDYFEQKGSRLVAYDSWQKVVIMAVNGYRFFSCSLTFKLPMNK